jgi:hypothetical protein
VVGALSDRNSYVGSGPGDLEPLHQPS